MIPQKIVTARVIVTLSTGDTLRSDVTEGTEQAADDMRASLPYLKDLNKFSMIVGGSTIYVNPIHIVTVELIVNDYHEH